MPVRPDPGLAIDRAARRDQDHQEEQREEGQEDDQDQARDHDVERPFRKRAVGPLVEVQDAHEPRRGELADRQAAEDVLVELGQPHDPEAGSCDFEQRREDLGAVSLDTDHDQIGAVLFDCTLQVGDRPEHGNVAERPLRRILHDDADRNEANRMVDSQRVEQVAYAVTASTNDEDGAVVGREPGAGPVPDGRHRQGRHAHGQDLGDTERPGARDSDEHDRGARGGQQIHDEAADHLEMCEMPAKRPDGEDPQRREQHRAQEGGPPRLGVGDVE